MEQYSKPLQYSFCEIDLENYFDSFFDARARFFREKGFDLTKKPAGNPDAAMASSQKQEEGLADVRSSLTGIIQKITTKKQDQRDIQFVESLQKKFELFQRVFTVYDSRMKKASETFSDISVYAMLSTVLLVLFQTSGNYNYLNTALKLNDFMVHNQDWITAMDENVVKTAFELEKNILSAEHENC